MTSTGDSSLQVGESLLEQRTGQVTPSFFLEFSQHSARGTANSPQQMQYLSTFLDSAEVGCFFLIMRGEVQLAKAGLFINARNAQEAFLGCCDVSADADAERLMAVLLTAVMRSAKASGVKTVYGPLDRSTWYNYRFRTDEHDLSFSWEPSRQAFLLDSWRRFGFQTAAHYESFGYRGKGFLNLRLVSWMFLPSYLRTKKLGYRFVPFHADWKQNLDAIYRIGHDAFNSAFLFQDISYSDFVTLYAPLGQSRDFSPSFFLVNPAGETVGFILSFYDQDYMVVKSLGTVSALRGLGLGQSLLYAVFRAAAAAGYNAGIAALIRRGNRSLVFAKMVKRLRLLSWLHTYELLAYHISDS